MGSALRVDFCSMQHQRGALPYREHVPEMTPTTSIMRTVIFMIQP